MLTYSIFVSLLKKHEKVIYLNHLDQKIYLGDFPEKQPKNADFFFLFKEKIFLIIHPR